MVRRAALLKEIRLFMEERNILEVDTPVLSTAGNTEPHIQSLCTELSQAGKGSKYYLNTSPEFAMKRLLASGFGAIYQITKVFRDDEVGRLHQPEFSMLEWYRPGYDHHQLMDELAELILSLGLGECGRRSYADVFQDALDTDPHSADTSELTAKAGALGFSAGGTDRGILLDFLFSHALRSVHDNSAPLFVYHYPLSQAALARLSDTRPQVAERFELFISGMEIANGFNELCDAQQQRRRFTQENARRQSMGLAQIPIDEDLLAALEHGLPDCAGVAVGLDRLLMALTGIDTINNVMTFPSG